MSKVPLGDISVLLTHLGRASTPALPDGPFGVTMSHVMGTGVRPGSLGVVVVVGSSSLWRYLPHTDNYVHAVPGNLLNQVSEEGVTDLVVDVCAFDEGPWIGSDQGISRGLAEEIFEAGRLLRAAGKSVFYLPPSNRADGPDLPYIRSTCTIDLADVPALDLEEAAPQREVWNILRSFALRRLGDLGA